MVLNTHYIPPGHFGPNAPVGAIQHDTVTQVNNWKRALDLFTEITNVKKATKNYIVKVIDESYVKNLRSNYAHNSDDYARYFRVFIRQIWSHRR